MQEEVEGILEREIHCFANYGKTAGMGLYANNHLLRKMKKTMESMTRLNVRSRPPWSRFS
ncbi:hypothetical protein E4K67_09290 [Desulfosporosinus fructosivorans]|uniref:Uncharacterized protein n=2 Tax=Desulfosporosinus fructosivorans TaxID=2018669 RepID=A0A4Z0R5P9_9FIRM|nr:hypothetical protein E4K67_09290 [Desulfosporosinus fructosivorans]